MKKRNNDMMRPCRDIKMDEMDEMEIINLHKKCNKKVRKTPRPKKTPSYPNQMTQARKNRGLTKHQGQAMEKRSLLKQGKKRPHSLKKHQSHLNLLTQARKKKKGCPRTKKGEKISFLLGLKEEIQSVFDFWKDSKNLTIKKKVERVVFMGGPMKATNYHMFHYMIQNTSKRC